MLGDETWLKLFPNMFDRHDGVSSFFVSPNAKVLTNVCLNAPLVMLRY